MTTKMVSEGTQTIKKKKKKLPRPEAKTANFLNPHERQSLQFRNPDIFNRVKSEEKCAEIENHDVFSN